MVEIMTKISEKLTKYNKINTLITEIMIKMAGMTDILTGIIEIMTVMTGRTDKARHGLKYRVECLKK